MSKEKFAFLEYLISVIFIVGVATIILLGFDIVVKNWWWLGGLVLFVVLRILVDTLVDRAKIRHDLKDRKFVGVWSCPVFDCNYMTVTDDKDLMERRKRDHYELAHQYTYFWSCPALGCGYQTSSKNEKQVEEARERHERTMHGLA